MKRFSLILLALILLVCASHVFWRVWMDTGKQEPEKIIAIARAEASKHGWNKVFVREVKSENDIWIVDLEGLPRSYGAHATVRIAKDGSVIAYVPGL